MVTIGYIYDPESGVCIALIKDDSYVFDATVRGERQIGTVRGSIVYNLEGELVAHLGPTGYFDEGSTPEAFRKLLKGSN